MNAIILCAGIAERMNGVDKQLLPVEDTTLLGRIIDQCKAWGDDKPKVITHKPSITEYAIDHGAEAVIPGAREWVVETFLSTKHLWSRRGKRTTVLLGDVFYVRDTFERIAQIETSLLVYGNTAEVFAVTFLHNSMVQDRLEATIQEAKSGAHKGKVRNFYDGLKVKQRHWRAVHDETMDVDSEYEYRMLLLQVGRKL